LQGISASETSNFGKGIVEGFLVLSDKNSSPGGILHGGANLAMAETFAGLGSMLLVDLKKTEVLGTQVSGNHTGILSNGKAVADSKYHPSAETRPTSGMLMSETRNGKLISTVRVTNMIVKRK
jgi:1,4-dihydroxy-2-naphthoyl-CoA hydrolase